MPSLDWAHGLGWADLPKEKIYLSFLIAASVTREFPSTSSSVPLWDPASPGVFFPDPLFLCTVSFVASLSIVLSMTPSTHLVGCLWANNFAVDFPRFPCLLVHGARPEHIWFGTERMSINDINLLVRAPSSKIRLSCRNSFWMEGFMQHLYA